MKFQGKSTAKDFREMCWSVMSKRLPRFCSSPCITLLMPIVFVLLSLFFTRFPFSSEAGLGVRQFGLFLSYHIGLPLSVLVVLMVGVLMIYYSMLSRKNPAGSEVTADDNGLRTEALDGSQLHYYSWDQTQTVIVSKNLYIAVFKNQIAIFFNKQILAGRDAEFEVILQRNVNPKLIKRRV